MADIPVNAAPPSVLLPYQQRLLETMSAHKVVIYEKHRRAGKVIDYILVERGKVR